MKQYAFHAALRGRVQGVGFRYYTVKEARRLNIGGWVKNTAAGGVEVWAEGGRNSLDLFYGWLRHGPPGARVDTIEKDEAPVRGYLEFDVEY